MNLTGFEFYLFLIPPQVLCYLNKDSSDHYFKYPIHFTKHYLQFAALTDSMVCLAFQRHLYLYIIMQFTYSF